MAFLRLQALGDLLRRYGAVTQAAWAVRRQLNPPARLPHEVAFLPANLELIETPVHPIPRWTMLSLMALAFTALLLAVFGRLDIVATAKGKLVPEARVKLIQPAVTGVVRSILVHDGQQVAAGQLLMELDTTQAAADSDKAYQSRTDQELAIARSRALLEAEHLNRAPRIAQVPGTSPARQEEGQRFAEGMYREFEDKLAASKAELLKRQAELDTTRSEIAKLEATSPLARQQADDYRGLVDGAFVARHDYIQKEQTALGEEHELQAQRSHARQLEAAVQQQRSEISSTVSQFRRGLLDTIDKATQQLSQSRNDETKTRTRERLLKLEAPVAGTVQQLSTHTLGGVVTTAQTLMTIVPDDAVFVEASVENKDVGFVRQGQDAIVKVEAFPYTRYGYLKGKVEWVSSDAVNDKKLGLAFTAHIRLPTNKMRVNDKWVNLSPGMEVTAEVNTGRRTVAQYFLDPLVEVSQESMRER